MRLYFTKRGLARLRQERETLESRLKAVQARKGPVGQEGTWHDNAEFEELVRQERMISRQLLDLGQRASQMIAIEGRPPDCRKLRIGHVARIVVDGETRTVEIGGYEDSDPTSNPPVMSYLAPLVRELIGKEVGCEVEVSVAGKKRCVALEDIECPGGGS